MKNLFCFGFGYSARALAPKAAAAAKAGWRVSGTCRTPEKQRELAAEGVDAHLFGAQTPLDKAGRAALGGAAYVLSSVPPGAHGDPVLGAHGRDIAAAGAEWIGYLSTTGVYGDAGGAWVDEDTPLNPGPERSVRRAEAEAAWLALHKQSGAPVHIFRLAGIYGPGRSALNAVRGGTARRIEKPGHVFSRIHADDIAEILRASITKPNPGRIYNVCDDEPAPPAAVTAFACELLGETPPAPVAFEDARGGMSAMALSFWSGNRKVSNARVKSELGVRLKHPTYREGLRAVLAAEEDLTGSQARPRPSTRLSRLRLKRLLRMRAFIAAYPNSPHPE
ncbi:MAG: SDR family oxidoreductase [Rhodospirillales bacterium]